jgi:hypothetical protein
MTTGYAPKFPLHRWRHNGNSAKSKLNSKLSEGKRDVDCRQVNRMRNFCKFVTWRRK